MPALIICFDYGQFWRLRLEQFVGKVTFIGFDHHSQEKSKSGFPANGVEVSDKASPSTTVLLSQFFKNVTSWQLRPEVAECLLVGLMADTGKLTNSLTSPVALEAAAEFMRQGADYHGVVEAMRWEVSRRAFEAQTKAREKVIFDEQAGLAFLAFSQQDLALWGVRQEDVLSLIGPIQNIDDVRAVAVYFERTDGSWYCSLRGKPKKGCGVRDIALHFSGGGHNYAAGFVSRATPEKLFRALAEMMPR